jgi:L-lactate dehydrogenase (cytochrome)
LKKIDAEALSHKAVDETLILAFDDDELRGCTYAKDVGLGLYVGKVAVHEHWRGIARQLLAAAEDLGRREGNEFLELQARIDLIENHRTLTALGLEKTGESSYPSYCKPTSITMRKLIAVSRNCKEEQKMPADLMSRFPALSDLEVRARRRMPGFAWEFLDSGTGNDEATNRNRAAFERVTLTPRFMRGEFEPSIATELFGVRYDAPFGVAPVGMNALAWPGTDRILAASAARNRIPYSMSTAANETPETLGALAEGMGWFQLYPPRSAKLRSDLLARARDSGFTTLLVTVDVPAISRRERQMRAGIGAGFGPTPQMLWQAALRPHWALATLRKGRPRLPMLERYLPAENTQRFLSLVGEEMNGTFDLDYFDALRREWPGALVLKGVLHPEDARCAVEHGADGILVSNHGGRQFDGAPASIDALPAIAEALQGRASVLLDSGVRCGLDVARALALGADFVLLGRPFMYAVAALGAQGADHAVRVLRDDLINNMSNLGCSSLGELRERLSCA